MAERRTLRLQTKRVCQVAQRFRAIDGARTAFFPCMFAHARARWCTWAFLLQCLMKFKASSPPQGLTLPLSLPCTMHPQLSAGGGRPSKLQLYGLLPLFFVCLFICLGQCAQEFAACGATTRLTRAMQYFFPCQIWQHFKEISIAMSLAPGVP